MDFSNYKFRCSGLGNLMIDGKKSITEKQLLTISELENKPKRTEKQEVYLQELIYKRDNPELSESTKTYLRDIYIKEVYGRFKDISNKYMEKGNLMEEDSLALMQQHYGKLIIKNKEHFENDYIKGTPDLVLSDRTSDAKSSWDIWTFFDADGSDRNYYWQGIGYMELTGKRIHDLIYCLNDTPEYLIVQEKTRMMYKYALTEGTQEFDDMEKQVEKNMLFSDIPSEQRRKVFSFEYNELDVKKLYERIKMARNYLNTLSLTHGTTIV